MLGRIPKSRIYQPGLAILNLYPLPNAQQFQNGGYNFTSQISDSYPRREDLIRIDYNLTSKLHMYTHYLNNSDAVTSAYGSFVLGTSFPKVPITDARPGYSFVVSGTYIFSPTLTNEATFGFGHNQINIDPVNNGLTLSQNGMSGLPSLYPSAIQDDFIPNLGFNGSRLANTGGFGTITRRSSITTPRSNGSTT